MRFALIAALGALALLGLVRTAPAGDPITIGEPRVGVADPIRSHISSGVGLGQPLRLPDSNTGYERTVVDQHTGELFMLESDGDIRLHRVDRDVLVSSELLSDYLPSEYHTRPILKSMWVDDESRRLIIYHDDMLTFVGLGERGDPLVPLGSARIPYEAPGRDHTQGIRSVEFSHLREDRLLFGFEAVAYPTALVTGDTRRVVRFIMIDLADSSADSIRIRYRTTSLDEWHGAPDFNTAFVAGTDESGDRLMIAGNEGIYFSIFSYDWLWQIDYDPESLEVTPRGTVGATYTVAAPVRGRAYLPNAGIGLICGRNEPFTFEFGDDGTPVLREGGLTFRQAMAYIHGDDEYVLLRSNDQLRSLATSGIGSAAQFSGPTIAQEDRESPIIEFLGVIDDEATGYARSESGTIEYFLVHNFSKLGEVALPEFKGFTPRGAAVRDVANDRFIGLGGSQGGRRSLNIIEPADRFGYMEITSSISDTSIPSFATIAAIDAVPNRLFVATDATQSDDELSEVVLLDFTDSEDVSTVGSATFGAYDGVPFRLLRDGGRDALHALTTREGATRYVRFELGPKDSAPVRWRMLDLPNSGAPVELLQPSASPLLVVLTTGSSEAGSAGPTEANRLYFIEPGELVDTPTVLANVAVDPLGTADLRFVSDMAIDESRSILYVAGQTEDTIRDTFLFRWDVSDFSTPSFLGYQTMESITGRDAWNGALHFDSSTDRLYWDGDFDGFVELDASNGPSGVTLVRDVRGISSIQSNASGRFFDSSRGRIISSNGTTGTTLERGATIHLQQLFLNDSWRPTEARWYSHTAAGNLRMAIYYEDGFGVLSRVWQSPQTPINVAEGELVIPISAGTPSQLTLPKGNSRYWLAWSADGAESSPSFVERDFETEDRRMTVAWSSTADDMPERLLHWMFQRPQPNVYNASVTAESPAERTMFVAR